MKKLFCLLAAAFLSAAGSLSAQQIRSLDIDVFITDEGDAYIKQVWDVHVVSGTEWYIPIENLGGMYISGLNVQENGKEFISDARNWDSSRSIEEKAGRCGIVEKRDGVELCWGQGSLGDHVWNVGYVALKLVQSLEDCDAFNYMFVNPDMIAGPKSVTLTFHRTGDEPFSFDYTRFWFFGTEGESELLDDGTIRFHAENMLRSDSVICMMRFDKGHFQPSLSKDMKFEKMQKKAFKGSTYKADGKKKFSFEDLLVLIVGGGFVLVIVGLVLLFLYSLIRDIILKITGHVWSKKVFGSTKPQGWEREAPFGGSIPVAAALLKDGNRLTLNVGHTERCIGAYFLKWIHEGIATPVKAKDGHFDMQFQSEKPVFSDLAEETLYDKAFDAAGENLILEKGEFDSWARKHYSSLAAWPKAIEIEGRNKLGNFDGDKVEESAKLLKFKNYLKDFTLAREREVPEVGLWGQYLVFAQIFGIADKVAKGFAERYPEQFSKYSSQYGLDSATMCTVVHSWSNSAVHAYKSAYDEKISREAAAKSRSSSGYGGHSSRGGGGGFSGGGHGGGSR
ncbi:MAG: DUF2207 domain-containing protein [Bacteroidales bacterium]|nr:DUF2207 domain-containing protein [Bacteroidales bacterium]